MTQGVQSSCAINKKISRKWLIFCFCDPAGARTQDPNIKSVVLYLLSYRVSLLRLQKYGFFRYLVDFRSFFFHASKMPLP